MILRIYLTMGIVMALFAVCVELRNADPARTPLFQAFSVVMCGVLWPIVVTMGTWRAIEIIRYRTKVKP